MNRSRWSPVAALALVAGLGSTAIGAPPPAWTHDHVLVIITAGDAGAKGFRIALGGPRARTGTGPGVFGIGIGDSKRGGGIFAVEQPGGPLEVSTTKQLGGSRFRLIDSPTGSSTGRFTVEFTVGELAPRQSALGIAVLGNARFAPLRLPRHGLASGHVSVRLVHLGGTRVTRVGDPTMDGAAASLGTAAGGTQWTSATYGTGIAGGFVTSGANLSTAGWRAPDGRTGRWVSGVATGAGALSFAGPAGRWRFDWTGADAMLGGSPVAWFTTPVGSYWRYLRCLECPPDPLPAAP